MEQTLTIKLLDKIKKATDNKAVRVELQALYSGKLNGNKYLWTCKGVTKVTEKDRVLLFLPNWYCGSEVEVTVELQKDAWPFLSSPWSPSYNKFAQDEDSKQPLFARNLVGSIKFVPQSEIKVTKMEWGDYKYDVKDKNAPLEVNTLAIAMFEMIGLNGQRLTLKIHTGNHEISLSKTVIENSCYFPFMPSKDFLGTAHKDKLKVDLYHDKNLLHSEKADLIEDSYKPVKLITAFPLQPVIVGNLDIVENNFHPCKYAKITVSYETKEDGKKEKTELIVFDEARSTKVKPVIMVGGEKTFDVELANYDTKKCKIKKGEKGSHAQNHAVVKKDEILSPIDIKNNGKFKFDVQYNYGAAKLLPLVAFRYFWPKKESLRQITYLTVDTCRHSKELAIITYPDIKWEVGFNAELAPEKYTSRNFKPGYLYEKAKKKAEESGEETMYNLKFGKTEAKFGLIIGCEYNDESNTEEYGSDIAHKIKDFLSIMLAIKEGVETLFSFAQGNFDKLQQSNNKVGKKVGNAAVDFHVDMPNIEFLGSWQAAFDKSRNEIYTKGSISIAAKPLIGAEINVDLWQIGSKSFPLIAFIQKAIKALGKDSLEVEVAIVFAVYGELNINGLTIALNNRSSEDSNLEGGLEGTIGAKFIVKLALGLRIITKHFETIAQMDANVTFDAHFTGSASFGADDNGIFFKPKLDFSGLKGTLTIEGELTIKSDLSWWKAEAGGKGSKTWSGTIIEDKPNIGDFKKHYMLNF